MKLRLESAAAGDLPEDARRQVRAAEEEVDRLAGIVDRLLATARRTEAAGPADGRSTDLGAARERALERWREPAARAGAALSGRGDGGLALAASADVDQMLDALIDNALKYAPGPIAVEAGTAGGWSLLAVEDRGPGVSPGELARIGERFYRAPGAARGGSGLGLAIVRELAEGAGGTLEVGPADGGGLRAEVRLPAAGSAQ
jgi:two-component system sensor histidine kinase TctE